MSHWLRYVRNDVSFFVRRTQATVKRRPSLVSRVENAQALTIS